MAFALFKGPFEKAGCIYEHDGWVTTDLKRGERVKWCPTGKKAFRWDVIENQWLPSEETRDQFLSIARQYQASVTKRK
jgi:hypothetical protein